jgi:hypothetical protein
MRPTALPIVLLLLACSSEPPPEVTPTLTRDELLDPQSCAKCHPDHHREWSGSMHAYAGDDPVFLAMNRRGQRETGGALGSFCVQCHAPVALREGLTTDGLNLAELPAWSRGVTCFACHAVDAVEGTHNNPLRYATDGVMRGGIDAPVESIAHRSAWSPLHDRDRSESSAMCGSCHDVVTPHGAPIERTFLEWKASVFSKVPGGATCSQCHMPQSAELRPVAAVPGAPLRRMHGHAMPGVDLATTPWPEREEQRRLVQQSLDETIQSALCVLPLGQNSRLQVVMDNAGAGHGFPSGAASDRRFWVEVTAYREGQVIYESGRTASGEDVTQRDDPDLWLMRDCLFDPAQKKTHHFWEAASSTSATLPALATFNPADPRFYATHLARTYPGAGRTMEEPDRVTMRLRLVPIGYDVLDDLVASGDLTRAEREAMTELLVGSTATVEWTPDAPGLQTWTDPDTGLPWSCLTRSNLNLRAVRTPAPTNAVCQKPD